MNRPNLNDKLFPKYPRAIQIQTVSGCNAACITCPTGLSPQRTEHKYLSMQLWEKVVEECSQLESPIHIIIVSLFNEPLIDKRLLDMVDMAKGVLPDTRFLLVTNGSLLTEKNIERMLQSKLDSVRVSINAYCKESYDLLKNGLDFHRIVEGTKKLLERSKELGKPNVIASMLEVQFNTQEVQQFVDFWSQLGAQVHVSPAWNRAGNLPSDNEYQLEAAGWSGKLCPKPFVTLCITCDGTVVLCCADYAAEVVLGNIGEQKLLEIWMGPKHQSVLLQILKKQNPLCSRCDKLASFQTQKGEFLSADPY